MQRCAKRLEDSCTLIHIARCSHDRDDAHMLVSVAGDVDITELVDRNKGVHVMMPKAIFTK